MVSQWVVTAGNHQPLLKAKHCWIDRVTQQLPPAQALRWQQGTMDPLSKKVRVLSTMRALKMCLGNKNTTRVSIGLQAEITAGETETQISRMGLGVEAQEKKKKRRKLNKTWNTPQNDVKNRKTSEDCLMPLSAWLWFQLSLLFSLLASKS